MSRGEKTVETWHVINRLIIEPTKDLPRPPWRARVGVRVEPWETPHLNPLPEGEENFVDPCQY